LDDGTQKLIHTYHDKGSFGELALLYNQPRAATIQAASEGSLWALDRQTFRRIILKSAFKKRKMYESLIDCVPMLKTLQVTIFFRGQSELIFVNPITISS
jgi:cAMP-dependent protein kinase regulator